MDNPPQNDWLENNNG